MVIAGTIIIGAQLRGMIRLQYILLCVVDGLFHVGGPMTYGSNMTTPMCPILLWGAQKRSRQAMVDGPMERFRGNARVVLGPVARSAVDPSKYSLAVRSSLGPRPAGFGRSRGPQTPLPKGTNNPLLTRGHVEDSKVERVRSSGEDRTGPALMVTVRS